jgi:uncharacterized protein YyaL (SSP411 family)
MNRLSWEKSPYLRLHKDDPVDWYPWGEEAFAKARKEDKPVFLSVGYSSCHWCHVMARESFRDPEVAALLNAHFVPVKVDREERPDLDAAYMQALIALTGQGGWPMSLFLTPEGRPFYGGTYFPPEDRMGLPGFKRVLRAVKEAWSGNRARLEEEAQRLAQALKRSAQRRGKVPDSVHLEVLDRLEALFDPEHGGFGEGAKFPQAPLLLYLLARAAAGERRAEALLRPTLTRMALGGVYDQVEGGFHRYAVDRAWRLPHFEKMLYDNALLARVYLGAWLLFREPLYARVARETLDFLRSLRLPEGGFAAALDAESEGEEGAYYALEEDEVALLGEEERLYLSPFPFGRRYALSAFGEEAVRARLGEGFEAFLAELKGKLRRLRRGKPRPLLDYKLLVDWNGLALEALAEAGRFWGEPYLGEAKALARRLLGLAQGGLLPHAHRLGESTPGLLLDQARVGLGLVALYEATGEWAWLMAAREVLEAAWVFKGETWQETLDPLPLPPRMEEGALPSGRSSLALLFFHLGRVFEEERYLREAEGLLEEEGGFLRHYPEAFPGLLLAHLHLRLGSELALPTPSPFLPQARGWYLPLTLLITGPEGALPSLRKEAGKAYFCLQGACLAPAREEGEVWEALRTRYPGLKAPP